MNVIRQGSMIAGGFIFDTPFFENCFLDKQTPII